MKKYLVITLICLFTNAQDVTFSTGDWSPYTDEKSVGNGFASEIVAAVMADMGEKHKLEFYPWTRALELAKNSQSIGSFPWSFTEERQKEFLSSDRFVSSKEVLFYLKEKGNLNYDKLSELKKYKIGGTLSYSHIEALAAGGLEVDAGPNDQVGMKKLVEGRIDLFPCDEIVCWKLIKEQFPDMMDKIATMPKALTSADMGVLVSKTNPNGAKFLEKFNKSLANITKSGKLAEIKKKYNAK